MGGENIDIYMDVSRRANNVLACLTHMGSTTISQLETKLPAAIISNRAGRIIRLNNKCIT